MMLPLKLSEIFSGRLPSSSVALATQSDTAAGSVQPMAGTTSRCIRSMILSISVDVMVLCSKILYAL